MKTSDTTTPFDPGWKIRSANAQLKEITEAEAKARQDQGESERHAERLKRSGKYTDPKVKAELQDVQNGLEMIPHYLKSLDEMRGPVHEARSQATLQLVYILDLAFNATWKAVTKTCQALFTPWCSSREEAANAAAEALLRTDVGKTLYNLQRLYERRSHDACAGEHDSQIMLEALDGLQRLLRKHKDKFPENFDPLPRSEDAFNAALPDHVKPRLADVSKPKERRERMPYRRGTLTELLSPEDIEKHEQSERERTAREAKEQEEAEAKFRAATS